MAAWLNQGKVIMLENYNGYIVGEDCLNPAMKHVRIETKARALEGNPITDAEIQADAIERERDARFRGICNIGDPLE